MKSNPPGPGRIPRPFAIVPAVTVEPRPLDDPRHRIRERCCDDCGELTHPVMMSCGDRTCPICRAKWYGQHYKSALALVSSFKDIRFSTLTEKNIAARDFRKAHIVQLRKWFSELRRRFPQILGGVYTIQATSRNDPATGQWKGWHPHIHLLYDGFFIKQKELSRAWAEITGGSFIVDIRKVTDPAKALGYILSDFLQAPRIREEDRDVYNEVFKGSRLLQTFGKYKGYEFKIPRASFKCLACGCEKSADWEAWVKAAEFREKRFSGDPSPPSPVALAES